MDRNQRNLLRLAVVRCRTALEEDYLRQLEGSYGITRDGSIAPESSLPQLDGHGLDQRRSIVAAIEHARAGSAGQAPEAAVEAFVRESAFSTLNRLTAIKLLEAPERRLAPESLGNGASSRGFRQFSMLSPEAMRAEPDGGYRLYLELLCEDLSAEIGVLFDLRQPQGVLFPSELTLRDILEELNAPALAPVWAEDETLGWVYQYFTPKEMRDEARKASSAPRNANELAFRNQFYTPRYVVEFLVDNTLGRTWYEMRRGDTSLTETCRYLVRRPHPIWLDPIELEPEPYQPTDNPYLPDGAGEMWTRPTPDIDHEMTLWQYALTVAGYNYAKEVLGVECGELANERLGQFQETGKWEGSFEELRCCLFFEQRRWRHFGQSPDEESWEALLALNQAICERWDLEADVIPYREKRDPRELRILDPACGSGHFLLYCFDLLTTIYDEAWDDPALGPGIQSDFADRDAYRREAPLLILRHNLHGIDIDLRAVQIAQLALWLRAQRGWANLEIRPADRPEVRRVNIVAAEPLPGERDMLAEFVDTLQPVALADLLEGVWDGMQNVGEIGSLLKADELIQQVVAEVKQGWQSGEVFDQVTIFDEPGRAPRVDLKDIEFVTDEDFWHGAEAQILQALQHYASSTANGDRHRRRLFADDAAGGFALLELFVQPFDVVLMNPPFGAVSKGAKSYVDKHYPRTKNDLYAAFVERGIEILHPGGMLGAITSRTGFFLTTFQKWREEILLKEARPTVMADLGYGVLDTAMVETAAYVLQRTTPGGPQ